MTATYKILLFILIVGIFFLFKCKKEEIYVDPVEISVDTVINVSKYGGSDGAIYISVSGGEQPYTYSWSNGAVIEDIDSLTAGNYFITVTDTRNKSETDTILITEPDPDSIILVFITQHVSIYGGKDGAIDLIVRGGVKPYTYHWSNNYETEDINNLSAGIYSVTVTDAIDSIKIDSTTINEPDPNPIILNLKEKHVTVYGGNDGEIELTVTGGVSPYEYKWSNGETTKNIVGLVAGVYAVTVTDATSKTKINSTEILQPYPDSLIIILSGSSVTYYGGNDGSIDLTVIGGVKPYTYAWSNGSNKEDIYGLIAGVYAVTVIDSINYTVTDSIEITQPEPNPLKLSLICINPTSCDASDGAIDLTVKGGYPPYSYNWSNGAVSQDLSNLEAGIYMVTVTDQIGQKQADTVELFCKLETVTDIDGNIYNIVHIGDQTWMKENLRVTKAPDGTPITSYCYNNNSDYEEKYGRLYTWNVAMNNSVIEMTQGICPDGWHVPSDNEFKILEMYLGMTQEEADMENIWRGEGVGTALKNGGNSGYDAMLSGRRSSTGSFSLLNQFEYMWTSSEYGDNAWRRCLNSTDTKVGRWNTFSKSYAFSVRCIKDE